MVSPPEIIEEPIEDANGDISIIDLDKFDDDDDVVEFVDLVSPEKAIHHKKRMIAQYLAEREAEQEVESNSLSDLPNFAHDFGISESFIIGELNRFEIDNPNVGIVMDEIVALIRE